MEVEQIKAMTFFTSAVVTKFGAYLAQTTVSDEVINKWIERGGSGLSIIFLLFGLRYLRGKLEDREKRLDELHNVAIADNEKSTEARIQLANSLDKLADKINNL